MSSKKTTILFVREVSWNSHYAISTRKIAGEFAKNGWNVIWLTPPLMPWHRHPKNTDEQEMFQAYAQDGVFHQDNVFSYTPRSYVPFSRQFPFDHPLLANWQWRFCFPSIPHILKKAKIPFPDLIWSSTFHSGGLKNIFRKAILISHVHDNFSGYPSTPQTCREIEKEQYQKASILFASAPSLKRMLIKDFNIPEKKIKILSPGVSLELYSTATPSCPKDLLDLPFPRLVTVGNNSKLDFDVLEKILACPDFLGSIVVIGESNEQLAQMKLTYPNLYLLGSVNPKDLPNYLLNCDVGLILMGKHMTKAAEHTCPMKLYEYAASGLPVLSTPLPIYEDLDIPIKIISDEYEISAQIRFLLEDKESIKPKMLEFASLNSWSAKYRQILEQTASFSLSIIV